MAEFQRMGEKTQHACEVSRQPGTRAAGHAGNESGNAGGADGRCKDEEKMRVAEGQAQRRGRKATSEL